MLSVLKDLYCDKCIDRAIDYIEKIGGEVENAVLSILLVDVTTIEVSNITEAEKIIIYDVIIGSYNTLISIDKKKAWNKIELTELPNRDNYVGVLMPRVTAYCNSDKFVIGFRDMINYHKNFSMDNISVNERLDIHIRCINPLIDLAGKDLLDERINILSYNFKESVVYKLKSESEFISNSDSRKIRNICLNLCHSIDFTMYHTEKSVILFIYCKLLRKLNKIYYNKLYNGYKKDIKSYTDKYISDSISDFTYNIVKRYDININLDEVLDYMLSNTYNRYLDYFINSAVIGYIIKKFNVILPELPSYNGCWYSNKNDISIEDVSSLWKYALKCDSYHVISEKEARCCIIRDSNVFIDFDKNNNVYKAYTIRE